MAGETSLGAGSSDRTDSSDGFKEWIAEARRKELDDPYQNLLVAAGTTVSALLAVAVLFAVLNIGSERTQEFRDYSAMTSHQVWAFAFAGTIVLWFGIAVVLWRAFWQILDPDRWVTVASIACYVVVMGLTLWILDQISGPPQPHIYLARPKLMGGVILILASAAPVAAGLWVSQVRLGQMRTKLTVTPIARFQQQNVVHDAELPAPEEYADERAHAQAMAGFYRRAAEAAEAQAGQLAEATRRAEQERAQHRSKRARELLHVYGFTKASLAAVSVGISAAVLTTGALRNAMLDAEIVTEASFPASNLVLYGGFFTTIFALIFIPSLVAWRGIARRLAEDAVPIPVDGKPDEEWFKERARMERFLNLDVGVTKILTSGLGIFAPLLTSAAAAFIPQLNS